MEFVLSFSKLLHDVGEQIGVGVIFMDCSSSIRELNALLEVLLKVLRLAFAQFGALEELPQLVEHLHRDSCLGEVPLNFVEIEVGDHWKSDFQEHQFFVGDFEDGKLEIFGVDREPAGPYEDALQAKRKERVSDVF